MGKRKNKDKSVKQSKCQALTSRNRKTLFSDSSPMLVHTGKKEEKAKGKDTLNEFKKFPFPLNKKQHLNHVFELINDCHVIIEVLDVRDIVHSRIPKELEFQVIGNPEKHLILLLNKIDLVNETFIKRQYNVLKSSFQNTENVSIIKSSNYSRTHIMEMFHSLNNEIGKYRLNCCMNSNNPNNINDNFFTSKYNKVRLGIIGYPHVGKESLINSLKLISSIQSSSSYISFPDRCFEIHQLVANCYNENDINSLFIPRTEKKLNKLENPLDLLSKIFEYISQEEITNIYKFTSPIITLEDLLFQMAMKYEYNLEKERNKIACHLIQDLINGKLNYIV